MSNNFKTIQRKDIFKGKIIDVKIDTIMLPNGQTAQRELVFHKDGAAVLPLTSENKVILVRQFRKPIEEEIYEIPAGLLEADEDPKGAALRELEEETGYKANRIEFLFSMYVSPGFCDEKIYIYFAQDLEVSTQNLDEDEFIQLFEFTMDEVEEMIRDQKIVDAKTISAYYAVKSKIDNK